MVTGGFLVGLAIAVVFTASFMAMTTMITTLQIVFHMPFMNLIMPGNVSLFFKTVIPIMTFDVLEYFKIMDGWFQSSKEYYDSGNHQLDQIYDIGYDTYNPIHNIGTLGFTIFLWVFRILILLIVFICFNTKLGYRYNFYSKMMLQLINLM